MEEKITFQTDEGEVEFFVLEQTRVSGTDYLLVTDSEEEDSECLILCDTSKAEEAEARYEIVDDDETLDALTKIFNELLENAEIEK